MPRNLEKNLNDPNKVQTQIQDYLNTREFMQDRLWTLTENGWVTVYNGKEMTSQQFNQLFPIPVPVNFGRCNNNPDKTRSYLNS